jgi:hypothetical protein
MVPAAAVAATAAGRSLHSQGPAAAHQSSVLQLVTSEFLSPEDLPPGTHLHLIVLNYVLPQQTAALWNRGARAGGGGGGGCVQVLLQPPCHAHTPNTTTTAAPCTTRSDHAHLRRRRRQPPV